MMREAAVLRPYDEGETMQDGLAENPSWGHQLRSYIAPGAPATRTPCDGTEPAMRVEFGFTPRWYRQHVAVDFSERWHVDPAYRAETVERMRAVLADRFPGLCIGQGIPGLAPGNLDGVHGAVLVAQLFGIPVEYYADNWPAAKHEFLSEDGIARLDVPVLEDAPVFVQLLEQMDWIAGAFGRIGGYLNWQGVLNNAYRLRGEALFTDLMVNAGLAHHLFEVIAHTMIAGMRYVYARQAKTGVRIQHATLSNCLVNMLSPEQYREHLMPYDRLVGEAFPHFGIHNCAWNVDPYIADYGQFPRLGYVDMGLDSDLARAKRCCPEARRALMYTPTDLANKRLDAIRADLVRIRRELSPCDIVMADIEAGTPDERVLDFARIAEECLEIREEG